MTARLHHGKAPAVSDRLAGEIDDRIDLRVGGKLIDPGVKVRGREYLRMVYGPSYLDDLPTLRSRDLRHKRSMSMREYQLGREALARQARSEPLWRIHECVFAILALESEPVDPRL